MDLFLTKATANIARFCPNKGFDIFYDPLKISYNTRSTGARGSQVSKKNLFNFVYAENTKSVGKKIEQYFQVCRF